MARRRIALATTFAASLVLVPHAQAQDWDCWNYTNHCLKEERDNVTFYVDTDGSMNVDSGVSVTSSLPGNETYWETVDVVLSEIADDNHNSGSCSGGMMGCDDSGCDGLRLGIGFYGDDSVNDSAGGIRNAYRAVSSGDDRRDDVKVAIADEDAGNTGLPGIETLRCPLDAGGQTSIFQCPAMGQQQIERIRCPANGGIQSDYIYCPSNGQAQEHRIGMPPLGSYHYWYVNLLAPGSIYQNWIMEVSGTTANFFPIALLMHTTNDIATNLATQLDADPDIWARGGDYTVVSYGPRVYVQSLQRGVAVYPTFLAPAPWGLWYNVVEVTPHTPGLPTTPPTGTVYRVTIDGDDALYTQTANATPATVCDGIKTAIDGLSKDLITTCTGAGLGTLSILSSVAGQPFTVNYVDPNLTDMGTTIPNLPGLPGTPGEPTTFSFDLNGNTIEWDHIGPLETSDNVCQELALLVNGAGENVIATPGPGHIRLNSTVAGDAYTINNLQGGLTHVTDAANGPGLPDDPGGGYVYDFTINGTPITYTGTPTSTRFSVCDGLAAAVNGSGLPVIASMDGDDLLLSAEYGGAGFTLVASDPELTRITDQSNVNGLPGTPGPFHNWSFEAVDVLGNTIPVSYASTGGPTTANVCAGIAAAIDATTAFTASATATTITVTPQADPALTWTWNNVAANTGLSVSDTVVGLPATPGPFHDYQVTIDGNLASYTDDGTPMSAEICQGMTNAINSSAGSVVSATHDGVNITITGNTAAAFPITGIDARLLPHIIVQPAGLGPPAYQDLGEQINADLTINDRTQHAVIITNRAPSDYADFAAGVTEVCARRNNTTAPGTTHVVALSMTAAQSDLLDILAAAGGSGTCGATDPCTGTNLSLLLTSAMTLTAAGTACSGTVSASPNTLKNQLQGIFTTMSCTFDLDVPPSYLDGQVPDDPDLVLVEINDWSVTTSDARAYHPASTVPHAIYGHWGAHLSWDYGAVWDDVVSEYYNEGWTWAGTARTKIRFTPRVCQQIRDGEITEIGTKVACLCSLQGQTCDATMGDPPPPTTCLSQDPANPGMVTCSMLQIQNMRCAIGTWICDDGVDRCTAQGDNSMPEICNGIDDNCDGIVDNVSSATVADFAGEDPEGRNCNFVDSCVCPDGWADTPSYGPSVADHLASWTGNCGCAEGLEYYDEGPAASFPDDEPVTEEAPATSADAACSTTNGSTLASSTLGLFAAFVVGRRRRRR